MKKEKRIRVEEDPSGGGACFPWLVNLDHAGLFFRKLIPAIGRIETE